MKISDRVATLALCCAMLFSATSFAADTAPRPVPTPDLSRLPAAKAEELRSARASFDQASTKLSGDALAETYVLLGSAYARAGFLDAAAVALDDAAQLAPHEGRWPYAQGLIARTQKRGPDAERFFNHAFELDKDYLPIRVAVVSGLVEKGDLDGARRLLTEFISVDPGQAVAYSMLADVSSRQKRYPEAVDEIRKALSLDPAATKLYGQLADAYAASGDAKAAADARAKAGGGVPVLADSVGLRLVDQNSPPVDPLARAVNRAQFFLEGRQYDNARTKIDEALQLKPNDAGLLAMSARIEAEAGNLPQARQRAAAAIAAGPTSGLAYLAQGYVLEAANDDDGARRAYEKASSLDGTLVEARLRLGNLYMRAGRFDQAATQYRPLAESGASVAVKAEGWTRLVAAEAADGKCESALKDVNGALAKDSRNGELLLLFVRLASTCPAVGASEKKMALDYADTMYRQTNAPPQIGEAYALAQAANGKWDEAAGTQEAAMFMLVRNGQRAEVPAYREFLQQFQAHKLPVRPWPAGSVLFNPPRAGAAPAVAAVAPAKK